MDFYQKFINEKAKHKRELLGSTFFPRTPIIFLDISNCKQRTEYKDLLAGLCSLDIVVFVIKPKREMLLPESSNIHYLDSSVTQKEKNKIMKAADFIVDFTSDVVSILKAGCIPIALQNGDSTVDYNPLQEKGNGFYFKNPTKWEVFATIVRALETYKFPFDWENLIRGARKN